MPAFTPGMRLHDRYLLEQRIGSGGMAQVWRAHDQVLGRQVAIKTVTGQVADDPALRAGARREAQAAAKLTHPNITAVHDYAELETADDSGGKVTPYLVMELLRGETLADRLARGPIPWPQAASIAGQIASALAAAHAQGVVHQDVKPANIMLTPSGVKVLDFGIAAMTGHRENIGWIIGTPAYAPPERLRQAPPDPSADVFGLGVILCEMVTGRQPFPIHSWEEAARYRYSQPSLPASVPAPAATAILAALDSSPQRRPSASALGRAIEGGPPPTLITPAGSVSAAASVPAPHHTQIYEPPPRLSKGTSPGLIAGVAVAALVVVLGAVIILSGIFAPNTKDPSALPSGGPAAGTTPSPTVDPQSVPGLLHKLSLEVDQAIASGDVPGDKQRDLRERVEELQQVSLSQKNNRDKELASKIRSFRERLENLEEDDAIGSDVRARLDAILIQLAAAVPRER